MQLRWLLVLSVFVVALAPGCPRLEPVAPTAPPAEPGEPEPGERPAAAVGETTAATTGQPTPEKPKPTITSQVVRTISDLQLLPTIGQGEYRVHLIDVGTGLAILIQGHDFNMLYDGGSADDKRGMSKAGNKNRLVAYLWAVFGPSGRRECKPSDGGWGAKLPAPEVTLNHVVLSHPHEDHGSLLADVLSCFDVDHVWDSGAVNHTAFYEDVVRAVASEPGVAYHTAAPVPKNRAITVRKKKIAMPASIAWTTFVEGETTTLGDGASFTVLHANGVAGHDFNENSIVLRLELGGASVLLTGDAESGPRKLPSDAVGDIEAHLLDVHREALDVDILQVGHHGSLTSSRRAFLDAVSPSWALIGCGPKKYKTVVLPDPEVMKELTEIGATIIVTNYHDGKPCPAGGKIGENDQRPGGCDNAVLLLRP